MESQTRRKLLGVIGSAIALASAGCTGANQETTPNEGQTTPVRDTENRATQTPTSQDQTPTTLTTSQRLVPKTESMGSFGRSVSVSGDLLVVGVAGSEPNQPRFASVALIYQREGSTWQFVEQLPRTGEYSSGFGSSVNIDSDRILIGASNSSDDSEAYTTSLFARQESGWQRSSELDPLESTLNMGYGDFAALEGDTAIVAAYRKDVEGNPFRGSVFAFTNTKNGWQQSEKIVPGSDGNDDNRDLFGRSVAVSGDTAVVGAIADTVREQTNTGAAYVFERQGSDWTQTDVLAPESLEGDARFGSSVTVGPEHLLVGAPGISNTDGAVYAYRSTSSGWTQIGRIPANGLERFGEFGFSVELHGSNLLVGAPGGGIGTAYLFGYRDGEWQQLQKLVPESGDDGANFGHSVSLSANTAVVGALRQNVSTGAGSVHTFDIGEEVE